MRRAAGILLLVIIFTLFPWSICAAEDNVLTYNNLNFLSRDSFQLFRGNLSLPEEGLRDFSRKGQEELHDLAALYGDLNFEEEMVSIGESEELEESVQLTPLPGIELNAGYGQELDTLQIEKWTNISIEYEVNSKTSLRAGYGLASRNSLDIEQERTTATEGTSGTIGLSGGLSGTAMAADDVEINTGSEQRLITDSERKQQKQLGISYRTNDYLTISADYITDDIKSDYTGDTAVLGLKYSDTQGHIAASYQIDDFETVRETVTGVELSLPDIATVSASYKLLNPRDIENQLKKESVWDIGLDVNISEVSTVSIGYQLKKNDGENGEAEKQYPDESSVEASFTIDF